MILYRNGEPTEVLRDLWKPNPAFLVGGGPSINEVDVNRFRERGIASIGVNQVAAHVPVRAWIIQSQTFKFSHAMFLDPTMMKFIPRKYLARCVMAKIDGQFHMTDVRCRDCPNMWSFDVPDDGPHTSEMGLEVLHHLGVRKVYLLGIDLHGNEGLCYGYRDKRMDCWHKRRDYERVRLLQRAENLGLEVYKCVRHSCTDFPYVPFADAMEDCRGGVPAEPIDTVDHYNNKVTKKQVQINPIWTPPHHVLLSEKPKSVAADS